MQSLGNRKLEKSLLPHCYCSSVTNSYSALGNPMDSSTPGFPVLHCLQSLLKLMSIMSRDAIQPSHPLSSPSPPALNFLSIRVFSNESALDIKWPKYQSFNISISPSNGHSGLISFRIYWFDLLSVQGTLKSLL